MNCSETEFVMPLYLSSELDGQAMAEFELHLQTCAKCARELECSSHCDDLLREAYQEQLVSASGVRERVLSEISKSRLRRRFWFARRPQLPIAAVLLLVLGVGIVYFAFLGSTSQTLYAAARDDHFVEVVQRQLRPWLEAPDEIRGITRAELGATGFIEEFKPAGFELKRALHCYLLQKEYLHLVYQNNQREISIFVRRKDSVLPGATVEVVNGCALHAAAIDEFEVVGFQSSKYTVLVVSDLPRAESLRIARNAALGLT